MNFHFTGMFYTYCPVWVKFIAVDHKMLLSDCELCINQCNDSHTLSKTVYKFLCVISTFSIQLGVEFGIRNLHIILLSIFEFHENQQKEDHTIHLFQHT